MYWILAYLHWEDVDDFLFILDVL